MAPLFGSKGDPEPELLQETTPGAVVPQEIDAEAPQEPQDTSEVTEPTSPPVEPVGYTVGTWAGLPNFLCSYPYCFYSTVKGEHEIMWHLHDAHPNWRPE